MKLSLIKVKNKQVSMTSLGKIFQYVLAIVEKLYSQYAYFKNLLKGTSNIKRENKKPNLLIKCDEKRSVFTGLKRKTLQEV